MNILRYVWTNKVLTIIAAVGLYLAIWLFSENYHFAVMSKEQWVNYLQSKATYCDPGCQAEVMAGLMDETNH